MIDHIENNNYQENDEEHKIDIYSLDTGVEGEYLQNYEALAKLKEEVFTLYKSYVAVAGFSFGSLIVSPLASLGFATLLSAGASLEYFRIITRLHDTMKMLLEHFGNDGIRITPRVRTNSAIIDLFIRMPDKRMFAVIIRMNENTSVIWREDRKEFFTRKKGKNAKKCDPLTRTIEQLQTIVDLKKNKHPLMGAISSERSAPLMKAIVLAPGSEIAASNSPEIWSDFGQTRVLKVRTTSITYVVRYDDLIEFLLPPKEKDFENVS